MYTVFMHTPCNVWPVVFHKKEYGKDFFSAAFPLYANHSPAAERQRICTSLTPARYNAFAHSLQVLPVVKISSTRSTPLPETSSAASKASFRFCRRSSGVRNVLWAAVSLFLRRPSFRKTSPVFSDIFWQKIWV